MNTVHPLAGADGHTRIWHTELTQILHSKLWHTALFYLDTLNSDILNSMALYSDTMNSKTLYSDTMNSKILYSETLVIKYNTPTHHPLAGMMGTKDPDTLMSDSVKLDSDTLYFDMLESNPLYSDTLDS